MRPLLLSGGPAVGKSTCGRALATERNRAAFIDVDDIRQLVVAGDATLSIRDQITLVRRVWREASVSSEAR